MSNEAAKVPADDTVPCRALAVVKRLLDVLRNVLLDVELEHRLLCCACVSGGVRLGLRWRRRIDLECHRWGERTDLDGFLLHLVAHVGGLDLGYAGRLVLARFVSRVPFSHRGDARGRWEEGRGWGQSRRRRTIDLVLRGDGLLLILAGHLGQSVAGRLWGLGS